MDEFIRQLTHDKEQLNNQWPEIFKTINTLSSGISENDKVKALDALVDYVLTEAGEVAQIKTSFIEKIIKELMDAPLAELVRIFCRVLEIPNTNNPLNLIFLKKFYYQFQLAKVLSVDPSVDLIDSIFICLQKHEFSDKTLDKNLKEDWKHFLSRGMFSPLSMDTNKFNNEQTMPKMTRSFQQLFRWAARNSHQSTAWSDVIFTLTRTFPTLFHSFTDPDDARFHLTSCVEPPVSADYVSCIAKSYQIQPDLFKTNESQIYSAMEKLISQNNIKEAERFMRDIIVTHISLITNPEELIHMLIRTCSSVNIESRDIFCKEIISHMAYAFARHKFNKKFAGIFFDLILAILDLNIEEAPESACRLLEINEFYPWKQLDKQITHLIQSCIAYDQFLLDSNSSKLNVLENIISKIQDRIKTFPMLHSATHETALQAVIKWAAIINNNTGKTYGRHVFKMGQKMTELIDRQKITVDICSKLIEILQKRIDNNDETYDFSHDVDSFLDRVAHLTAESFEQLKTVPLTLHQQLASCILSALDCPLKDENGSMTLANRAALYLWFKLGKFMNSEDDARVYEPCVDRIYKLICDEGETHLRSWWNAYWCWVCTKYPNVAVNHIPQFLEEIIDRKETTLAGLLTIIYAKSPESFHTRFDDLIHITFEDNGKNIGSYYSLLEIITKTHPEIITSTQIDYLFTSIKDYIDTTQATSLIFRILGYIANAQPHLFDKHRDELLQYVIEQKRPEIFNCLQQYLVASAILNGEKTADECLTLLINLLKNTKNIPPDLSTQIFYTCQLIGIRYKQILINKRNEFIAYESNSTCRMLIDFIDGNKLSEENQAAINQTLNEIAQIEKRVVHTEQDVKNITKTIKRQELNITNLDTRVNVVDTRVNDLAEQVDFHARELERIDAKTLSYVPTEWGRDVCTLLNIRANNDWRLLGKRFGYSTSELKHWAMQLDPSMSLLNEWFMTHKADEATYGLVKMLKEIGRQDVEEIIRKAVTAAGELIPDDLPMEIKRLPPVFLSYQWGSQKAVSKLKTNLEQAGYSCWMDTGQMGGGDKLFAKIDAGIRGAKVVICCMNTAYAQSDNCSREVHLTISTGKPLIPLQMEKQTWPPEGALGPIMSEYLFIRFFDRKHNDENYWPADKFTELLGQIRYHVAPDPDMITEQYHNWFVPRVDNLIFLQPTPTTTTNENKDKAIIKDDTPLVVTHPQVMISYQWDYQTDIVVLYKKLTKLGYRCWLDIFQMGGGDSLFEKIDTGIRHAKCVLSCVTPKYTKSINCRREMALADALQKPLVPLLLEETSTWPPPGPMAMVFAEKPYIDFRRANNNDERWIGKEFELVLARLKQTIPEVQTEKPQRHLLDMQRPTTAIKQEEKPKRIRSAPVTPQSRACSIM